MDVRGHYFGKHTVKLGIGGSRIEDVIWCIGNLDAHKEVRCYVLIYGTNSIDKNVPEDIVKRIKYAIQLIKCKCYNFKVIVSGLLIWEFSPGIQRNKIRSVNLQIKSVVAEINNKNDTYIDPDHTWTTSGGALNTNLYYNDNLNLIEKGNEKRIKATTITLNVESLRQQQKRSQVDQQHKPECLHHQQKYQNNKNNKSSSIKKSSKTSNRTTKIKTKTLITTTAATKATKTTSMRWNVQHQRKGDNYA